MRNYLDKEILLGWNYCVRTHYCVNLYHASITEFLENVKKSFLERESYIINTYDLFEETMKKKQITNSLFQDGTVIEPILKKKSIACFDQCNMQQIKLLHLHLHGNW